MRIFSFTTNSFNNINTSVKDNNSAKDGQFSNRTSASRSVAKRKHLNQWSTYRQSRTQYFLSWYENNGTDVLKPNADAQGPILDFIIAGFPKCGTTTMEANLGRIAPMPVSDVCTPVPQTVYYAYKNWPIKYHVSNQTTQVLRGTKCPRFIQDMKPWSDHLPRAKVIVGIRHPILWFQSFWNMQTTNFPAVFKDPYKYVQTKPCGSEKTGGNECPPKQLFCLCRARFHIFLARLGKTNLTAEERSLLAPKDNDGGSKLISQNIRNQIYLYEQTTLKEDDVWETLADFIQYDGPIAHDIFVTSHGKEWKKKRFGSHAHKIDICEGQYDDLRKLFMPYAYEMSEWFCNYLIPPSSEIDVEHGHVVVANRERFCSIVENYKYDPCNRLIRLENGTYILNISMTSIKLSHNSTADREQKLKHKRTF